MGNFSVTKLQVLTQFGHCGIFPLLLFLHTARLFYDHLWIESKLICFLHQVIEKRSGHGNCRLENK